MVAANLCTAYRYREDLVAAEAVVEQALQIDPSNQQALRDKLVLLSTKGGRHLEVLTLLDQMSD